MSQFEGRETVSHWAASEEHCEQMEKKYGWKLVDTRRNSQQVMLPVECIFEGEAEFPKASIDYSAGQDDD